MDSILSQSVGQIMPLFKPHLHGIESILDVGTGTSIPIHAVSEAFPKARVETIDIADYRQLKQLPFRIYDGAALPYDFRHFEVSVLNETLHHCSNPLGVLNESSRVAGQVYVVEHFPTKDASAQTLYASEYARLRSLGVECAVYRPFTTKSIYDLFRFAGLTVKAQFQLPYEGSRPITKHFFKLQR